MTAEYILPLSDPRASLETVGGKAASLARLASAGFPVPDGFTVTTAAYQDFAAASGLQRQILGILAETPVEDVTALEAASAEINSVFMEAPIPAELGEAIARGFAGLCRQGSAFAVRSSATAEDLPDLSFAGQQETYLNVRGLDDLTAAIKRCWASLWTARAISYRAQHGIPSDSISLAVVVQVLFPAEAAGVMFTANPTNGRRGEGMITAAWGLGEAVVGGLVTPDTLVVEKSSGKIITREIARKEIRTVLLERGTQEAALPEALQNAAVLTDDQACELTRLGCRIEALYGQPMDIEWALAGDRFAILQARPITALPEEELDPPGEWRMPDPRRKYARASLIDLLPDPLTPLFRTFAGPVIEEQTRRMYTEMTGMRDWSEPIFSYINDYAYASISFPAVPMMRMVFASLGKVGNVLSDGDRAWREDAHPAYARVIARWQERPVQDLSCAELLAGAREIMSALVYVYTTLQTGMIPASVMSETIFTQVYNRLIRRRDDPEPVEFLLGFESAPIEADLALYALAEWARGCPGLAAYLTDRRGDQAAADMRAGISPAGIAPDDWQDWQVRFQQYLIRYGHALYDLDFSKPVPADDPAPLLETLRLYLRGESGSPAERLQRQGEQRDRAVESILARTGGLKRGWFLKALRSAQRNAPMRENGLADLGLGYPLLRRLLLEFGRRLAGAGMIHERQDVFWLLEGEAQSAAEELDSGAVQLPPAEEAVAQRKRIWKAEKRVTPPTLLPEASRFLGLDVGSFGARTSGQAGDTIKGTGAYPGRVTGVARVLRGPEDFGLMQSGEILVAAITTPAWTPLFAKAAAIVTDIGGPLSHSSIVAREYGIPAVLGAGVATRRIRSGQVITVDGSAGLVSLDIKTGK